MRCSKEERIKAQNLQPLYLGNAVDNSTTYMHTYGNAQYTVKVMEKTIDSKTSIILRPPECFRLFSPDYDIPQLTQVIHTRILIALCHACMRRHYFPLNR